MPYEDIEHDLARRARLREVIPAFIPTGLLNRLLGDPETGRDTHQKRRAAAKQTFEATVPELHETLEAVREAVEPALDDCRPLPTGKHAARIELAQKQVATLTADIDRDYLREAEVAKLKDLRTDLQELHERVTAKQTFDTRIDSIQTQTDHLQDLLAPYRTYDEYLLDEVETTISTELDTLDSQLDSLTNAVEMEHLPAPNRARLTNLADWVTETRSFLEGYNAEFVEREIHAHDDLFIDIDAAGHDLTLAQRRAIVRNDTRNQVIAAAGTGKTLVLTYRIAYLVAKQGVDPERIAAVTFTKEAMKEMATRLDREFDITAVEVSTLHAFGRQIATAAADRHLSTVDPSTIESIIQDVIRDATATGDSAFAHHYYQFLIHDAAEQLSAADFETQAAYVAARQEQTYTTLRGETVRSRAEKVIADFLFTHQIDYQYEPLADWADTGPEKGPYTPDFRLPAHDCYIEHWGLDAAGEVAPWFTTTTEEYHEKVSWAREQFAGRDATLLETYEFEHEGGRLTSALAGRLRHAGVDLDRLAFEDFVESVVDYNEQERTLIETFQEFIARAKQFDIDAEQIPGRLDRTNPRQYHFGRCGAIMLRRYNERLATNDMIDFADMISRATDAVREHPSRFRSQYDHILVDEFQDVAPGQVRLLQALVGDDADTRLFCVGDDWQSIYAFRGAEMDSFINFGAYFDPPTTTTLTENYRCPATVLEAGNALIANNDAQLEKEVTAATDRDTTPRLHTLAGYSDRKYANRVGRMTADLVEAYLDRGSDPSDVMVLCRYDTGAPFIQRVKTELEGREIPYDGKKDAYRPGQSYVPEDDDAGVDAFSMHQAKGREARHVIIVHVATGPHAFPARKSVDELLAPVVDTEVDKLAEERRLFYVALTRTAETLDVLTRSGHRSRFVDEIDAFLATEMTVTRAGGCDPGERVDVTAQVQRLWDETPSKQHQAGILEDRTGTRKFVSWRADEPLTVVPEQWYQFENLRVDEYDGETRLVLDGETSVTRLAQGNTASRS